MRIHLELLDANGLTLQEASFESSVVTLGAYDEAMFLHRLLPRLEIRTDGYHATIVVVAQEGQPPQRLLRKNSVPLFDGHNLHVGLYPRPDAVPRRRGSCPACGDDLVERRSGGAYRSIARTQRSCAACGAMVLTLRAAREAHGHFSDRSRLELVAVTVAARCPQCLESMSRANYVFENREINVERCAPCELVVFDREDQAQLGRT